MLHTVSYSHLAILAIMVLLFVLVIWAAVVTIADTSFRPWDTVVWIVILVMVPVLGLLTWLITRLVKRRRNAAGRRFPSEIQEIG